MQCGWVVIVEFLFDWWCEVEIVVVQNVVCFCIVENLFGVGFFGDVVGYIDCVVLKVIDEFGFVQYFGNYGVGGDFNMEFQIGWIDCWIGLQQCVYFDCQCGYGVNMVGIVEIEFVCNYVGIVDCFDFFQFVFVDQIVKG